MQPKIIKSCLFCGSDACLVDLYPLNFKDEDLNGKVFSARRITEHFHYKIMRCRNTGLVLSREILSEEDLKNLYSKSEVTFTEYAEIIRKDYWRPLEQIKFVLRRGSALEIGCSNGFFLEELLKQGFKEALGCEPSHEAKEKASDLVKANIHTGFFKSESYADSYFDLICSFQTLDHLSDPIGMLQTCYRKLRLGGLLYIIVHNVDSLQSQIFGEKSPIIDVEHIYLFNIKTLAMATEKAGLKTVDVFHIKNSYPIHYLVNHAPLPFKKLILAILKTFRLDNLQIPLSLGNIGIIAKKE
jgi:SAM-dependent methyltransferase